VYEAVLTTGVEGDVNGAYQFGGDYNSGNIGIQDAPQIHFTNEATFSFYIKPMSWKAGYERDSNYDGAQCFFSKQDSSAGLSFCIRGSDENMFVFASTTNYGWQTDHFYVNSGPLSGNYLNKWTHVAFVYGQGHSRLYVDGKLVSEEEFEPEFGYINQQNVTIGLKGGFGNSHPYNGIVDEVRIYNRALSADEVEKLSTMFNKKEN
jgi:hypothetical protein